MAARSGQAEAPAQGRGDAWKRGVASGRGKGQGQGHSPCTVQRGVYCPSVAFTENKRRKMICEWQSPQSNFVHPSARGPHEGVRTHWLTKPNELPRLGLLWTGGV